LQAFSNEILDGTYKAAQDLYSDESAKNPAFKKIFTEWDKYRKTQTAWFSLAEARMNNFLQSRK
jgi:TRAP-type mannitol/chloroaromatic compound transport system substrate-binding protein